MTTNEYNSYIKNYLKNDKTQSAIMLTAPWGTGKSYYIRNDLSRFLEENKLSYCANRRTICRLKIRLLGRGFRVGDISGIIYRSQSC